MARAVVLKQKINDDVLLQYLIFFKIMINLKKREIYSPHFMFCYYLLHIFPSQRENGKYVSYKYRCDLI